MKRVKIDQELLTKLSEAEAQALRDGMNDDELVRSPAFLGAVRRFLKDNKLVAQPEDPKVQAIQRKTSEIPDFDFQQ